jgi:hypothetical protein
MNSTAPEAYFANQFWIDLHAVGRPLESRTVASRLEQVYGVPVSSSLAKLVDFCASNELDRGFGAFYPWPLEDWLPGEKNSAEFMLEQPFRTPAALLDSLALGCTGSGDYWYFSLEPACPSVAIFDHETCELVRVADSVEVFALTQSFLEFETQESAALQSMEGRYAPRNDFDLGVVPTRPLAQSRQVSARAERVDALCAVLERGHRQRLLPSPVAADIHAGRIHLPGEALYELWRLFLQSEEEALRRVAGQCAQHPASLLRDAAELFGEILDGRKWVAGIDVQERRSVMG